MLQSNYSCNISNTWNVNENLTSLLTFSSIFFFSKNPPRNNVIHSMMKRWNQILLYKLKQKRINIWKDRQQKKQRRKVVENAIPSNFSTFCNFGQSVESNDVILTSRRRPVSVVVLLEEEHIIAHYTLSRHSTGEAIVYVVSALVVEFSFHSKWFRE